MNSQNGANYATWKLSVVKASISSWQLGEGATDTLCVWEGEVECIAWTALIFKGGQKGKDFISQDGVLMTCFSWISVVFLFSSFLPFAKSLTIRIETHWLLISCLRPWFDRCLHVSLSSCCSLFSSAKRWKGRGEAVEVSVYDCKVVPWKFS